MTQAPGINVIKLWQKVNGKKRKVTNKFFEAFFGEQQKIFTNFIWQCFSKWLFCHSREKGTNKLLIKLMPWANVIKLFTAVFFRHSMVILSFCVIKHYYYGKYHRMAINCRGKKFSNIGPRIQRDKTSLSVIKYHSKLPR